MSSARYGLLAAAVALFIVVACEGADRPGDSGSGGAAGGASQGGDVCQRAIDHVNGCLGTDYAEPAGVTCTSDQACEAACYLDAPCSAFTAGVMPTVTPAARELGDCLARCYGVSSGSPAGSGGSGSSDSTSDSSDGSGASSSDSSSSSSSSDTTSSSSGDSCPFGSIDCSRACSNYLAWCGDGSDCSNGCTFTTQDTCVAGCQYEVGLGGCYIPIWGCYADAPTCVGSAQCYLDAHCPGC